MMWINSKAGVLYFFCRCDRRADSVFGPIVSIVFNYIVHLGYSKMQFDVKNFREVISRMEIWSGTILFGDFKQYCITVKWMWNYHADTISLLPTFPRKGTFVELSLLIRFDAVRD
jgi:hypothetical protein